MSYILKIYYTIPILLADKGKDITYFILRLISDEHPLISFRTPIAIILGSIGFEPCRCSLTAGSKSLAVRYLLLAPRNRLLPASMHQIDRTRAAFGCHIEIIIGIQLARYG